MIPNVLPNSECWSIEFVCLTNRFQVMAPIATSPVPATHQPSKMNNSGTTEGSASSNGKLPDLSELSMTLPTRHANDHVDDTEKIKKMADAVRTILEVR